MDNGQAQTPQGQPNQEFFTAGVGDLPPENSDPNFPDLKSDIFQDPKELARQAAVRASLGNTAIKSPEPNPLPSESSPMPLPGESGPINPVTPKLGQIVDTDTPPLVDHEAPNKPTPDSESQSTDKTMEQTFRECFGDGEVDRKKDYQVLKAIEENPDPAVTVEQLSMARAAARNTNNKEDA